MKMDKELKEFLDKKFSRVDEKIDKSIEGAVHRFQIITEKVEDRIQQIAEGVTNLNEKFDRRLDEMNHSMEQRHQDILSAIKFSYAELDGRIKTLELQLKHLDERVRRLESH
jgi:phage shock protein A